MHGGPCQWPSGEPRFMQFLIIADVKKSFSPLRSVAILRKSSSRIGQMALVGCCGQQRERAWPLAVSAWQPPCGTPCRRCAYRHVNWPLVPAQVGTRGGFEPVALVTHHAIGRPAIVRGA